MKKITFISLLLVFTFASCNKKFIEKPKKLINEKKMIEMLVDVHLAEATYREMQGDTVVRNSSSANFYYSVLEKYHVPDSVFEKSFVYYASYPRKFEQMYRKVMNQLSAMEQQFSGRKEELDFQSPQ